MCAWEDGLIVVNATPEAERAALWVAAFADRTGLAPDITSRVQVILDEAVSNVFRHALAGAAEGTRQIGLQLRRRGDRVELEVTDDGIAFDMSSAAALAGRARRPGGGLAFLRVLADEIGLSRDAGRNRLFIAVRMLPAVEVRVDGGP